MTHSPVTTAKHHFCIVNCYPKASRKNFDLSDVGHPHDLFLDFLRREAPNASSEIVYVADPVFAQITWNGSCQASKGEWNLNAATSTTAHGLLAAQECFLICEYGTNIFIPPTNRGILCRQK